MSITLRLSVIASLCIALFSTSFFIFSFTFPTSAEAASMVWSNTIKKDLNFVLKGTKESGDFPLRLENTQVQVEYNVRVKNKATGEVLGTNVTVPQNTELSFEFLSHKYTNITWFTTGGIYDSPYGIWLKNATLPKGLCSNKEHRVTKKYLRKAKGGYSKYWFAYGRYSVDPPKKSISGLGGADCSLNKDDDKVCTMKDPGTYTITFTAKDTPGKFWVGIAEANNKSCQDVDNKRIDTKSRSITYTITVEAPKDTTNQPNQSNPPNAPTAVSAGGQCVVGTPHTITMTATDPDGDQIRYAIDWDLNGTIDEFVPAVGYVPSGTPQSASRTYSTGGQKDIRVLAIDDGGLTSGWTTYSFVCAEGEGVGEIVELPPPPPPPPPAPNPDLSLRAIPSLVRNGATTKLFWSATNVASCTVTGTNGDAFTGTISEQGGENSSPITQRTTYTLSCTDLAGEILTKTATVNIVPTWQEI